MSKSQQPLWDGSGAWPAPDADERSAMWNMRRAFRNWNAPKPPNHTLTYYWDRYGNELFDVEVLALMRVRATITFGGCFFEQVLLAMGIEIGMDGGWIVGRDAVFPHGPNCVRHERGEHYIKCYCEPRYRTWGQPGFDDTCMGREVEKATCSVMRYAEAEAQGLIGPGRVLIEQSHSKDPQRFVTVQTGTTMVWVGPKEPLEAHWRVIPGYGAVNTRAPTPTQVRYGSPDTTAEPTTT